MNSKKSMSKMHLSCVAAAAMLAGCGGGGTSHTLEPPTAAKPNANANLNFRPAFVTGTVRVTEYDGVSDDLLTAGLGATGLGGAAPGFVDPLLPTAAELRRLAIHTNYRALVDPTSNGGYGRLYGPNVTVDGVITSDSGKIAGAEYIAYADDGSGRQNVTMMVQVPSSFDPKAPCIVSATSSGSRGVYGAIATAGEWGLKHRCAVAYTDKGTGLGVHDLQADTVNLIDGRRSSAATAGTASNFTAALSAAARSAFNALTPNRFAVKHAHSQQNPEKDWGQQTLQAIEFAFYVLNERYSTATGTGLKVAQIRPHNTLVIASSVSNGAGAALAAAEQDESGMIDGVAVSEPSIQLAPSSDLRIERGSLPAYTGGSKPLFDYFSYGNLLQACAALAPDAAASPFLFLLPAAGAANRCTALAAAGLVSGASTGERAADALLRLRAYGWEPDANLLHATHFLFASPAIAVTYANTYGRFSVADNTCGFSFGATDAAGVPVAAAPAAIAAYFGTGNGVPPSGALNLVYNNSVGGARKHDVAATLSPSTSQFDFAFDGANCLRQLWTGSSPDAARVHAGVAEVYRGANLRGKPAIVVHGRNDTLIPVNFSSRPYVLRNHLVEGAASQLRYIEVTNAQHFESFLTFAGYDSRFIPLHVYYNRALDAMWAHLKDGSALPGSQVVRTTPRGGAPGAAPAIQLANLPAISAAPSAADAITISGSTLRIPD
ncbi:MAG: 3-hydroxybutyrate oligomer hydrolase family protein [Pseudomonadota bacterium]